MTFRRLLLRNGTDGRVTQAEQRHFVDRLRERSALDVTKGEICSRIFIVLLVTTRLLNSWLPPLSLARDCVKNNEKMYRVIWQGYTQGTDMYYTSLES